MRCQNVFVVGPALYALARALGRSAILVSVLSTGTIWREVLHVSDVHLALCNGERPAEGHPFWSTDASFLVIGLDTLGEHAFATRWASDME